jgi:hypothetical protein
MRHQRLKHHRSLATRYDKPAVRYAGPYTSPSSTTGFDDVEDIPEPMLVGAVLGSLQRACRSGALLPGIRGIR